MGQEHRCKERFELFVPITVSVVNNQNQISAVTRNVSSGGVYFYTQGDVNEGDTVEFQLTLPAVLTQAGDMPTLCEGKVLRVDPHQKEGLSGVAVRIDALTFLEPVSGAAYNMQRSGQA